MRRRRIAGSDPTGGPEPIQPGEREPIQLIARSLSIETRSTTPADFVTASASDACIVRAYR